MFTAFNMDVRSTSHILAYFWILKFSNVTEPQSPDQLHALVRGNK